MEKAKKLKDLKKGDRVWFWHFTCTTPITVIKAKRTGDMVEVILQWDDHEYVCYGHALGYDIVGYSRQFRSSFLFTTNREESKEREDKQKRNETYESVGRMTFNLIKAIKKLNL